MRLLLYIALIAAVAIGVVWMTHRANENPSGIPFEQHSQIQQSLPLVPAEATETTQTIVVGQLMFAVADPAVNEIGKSKPVTVRALPHYWATEDELVARPNNRASAVYTAIVDLHVPNNELWSIYLPHVVHDAEFALNGNAVGRTLQPPRFTRTGLRSIFLPLPRGALQRGKNTFEITLTAKPLRKAMLGKFYIGAAEELRPWHDARAFQHQLLWFVVIALGLIGLIAMVLGLSSENDPTYNWYAAMCLIWLIASGARLLTQSPIDWQWIELVGSLGDISFICVALLFCLSFIDQTKVIITRLLIGLGVTAAIMYAATAILDLHTTLHMQLSIGALQASAFYITFRFYKRAWEKPNNDILLLALAGSLVLGFGVYDTVLGFSDNPPAVRYLTYVTPTLFVVIGYILLQRFSRALKRAEHVQALQPTASVEKAGTSTTGARRILVAERERIMRDMHDGVGGHLVSSLAILRNHQISDPDLEEAINKALVDLRLMIDSLEETDGNLSVAVAMLKDRTQRVLKNSDTDTSWRIGEIILPERGPADTLQILRIVQESVSNVLKHADADQLAVSAEMVDRQLAHFCIHDNGKGFDLNTVKAGRGLLNLQHRADVLGAQLEINSSGAGTRVDLWVPNVSAQIIPPKGTAP